MVQSRHSVADRAEGGLPAAATRQLEDTDGLEDFPTLQTLNQTGFIQDRVRARYNELEQAASNKTQSSGTVQELVDIITVSKEKKI